MLTQKGMLRIAEIKGWEIVRSNRSALDLSTGTYYAYFTFKEHSAFQCQVAQSRVEKFKQTAGIIMAERQSLEKCK